MEIETCCGYCSAFISSRGFWNTPVPGPICMTVWSILKNDCRATHTLTHPYAQTQTLRATYLCKSIPAECGRDEGAVLGGEDRAHGPSLASLCAPFSARSIFTYSRLFTCHSNAQRVGHWWLWWIKTLRHWKGQLQDTLTSDNELILYFQHTHCLCDMICKWDFVHPDQEMCIAVIRADSPLPAVSWASILSD